MQQDLKQRRGGGGGKGGDHAAAADENDDEQEQQGAGGDRLHNVLLSATLPRTLSALASDLLHNPVSVGFSAEQVRPCLGVA